MAKFDMVLDYWVNFKIHCPKNMGKEEQVEYALKEVRKSSTFLLRDYKYNGLDFDKVDSQSDNLVYLRFKTWFSEDNIRAKSKEEAAEKMQKMLRISRIKMKNPEDTGTFEFAGIRSSQKTENWFEKIWNKVGKQ